MKVYQLLALTSWNSSGAVLLYSPAYPPLLLGLFRKLKTSSVILPLTHKHTPTTTRPESKGNSWTGCIVVVFVSFFVASFCRSRTTFQANSWSRPLHLFEWMPLIRLLPRKGISRRRRGGFLLLGSQPSTEFFKFLHTLGCLPHHTEGPFILLIIMGEYRAT